MGFALVSLLSLNRYLPTSNLFLFYRDWEWNTEQLSYILFELKNHLQKKKYIRNIYIIRVSGIFD